MKKFIWYLIVFALVLGTSCKKKEKQIAPPKPAVIGKISEQEFVLQLVKSADMENWKEIDSIVVPVNNRLVASYGSVAVVKQFKSNWNYSELLPVNKQIPLTIVWLAPESGKYLLVSDYTDLKKNHCLEDNFIILEPRPKYYVIVGKNKYWVSKDREFWKVRK